MSSLFSNSKSNSNTSKWSPLKLEHTMDMFLNSKAPTPYWFESNNYEILKNKIL